eukprot:tig00020556_g10990.t1
MALHGDGAGALELEHIIGYSGAQRGVLHLHPKQNNIYVYPASAMLVVGDLDDSHKQEVLRGHDADITATAVSPSGRLIASGQSPSPASASRESPVIVFDFDVAAEPRCQQVFVLRGIVGGVLCLCFSPDDRFLAIATADSKLVIYDMTSGTAVQNHRTERPVTALAFAFGPSELATTGRSTKLPGYLLTVAVDTRVKILAFKFSKASMQYEVEAGEARLPSTGLVRSYTCAAVDETGVFAFLGTNGSDMVVFDTHARIYRQAVPVGSPVLAIVAGPSPAEAGASRVFVACADGRVRRLTGRDLAWRLEAEAALPGQATSVALSADGKELLVGTSAGAVHSVSAGTLQASLVSQAHTGALAAVAFGGASGAFATASADCSVAVWSLDDYTTRWRAALNTAARCLVWDPEADALVAGGQDGSLRCLRAATGEVAWSLPNAHRGAVTALAVSPAAVFSGGEDGHVRVWSRRDRSLVGQLSSHRGPVTGILLQDALLHSASTDRSVVTVDTRTERRVMTHQSRESAFTCLTQRKDSEQEVVTGSADGCLHDWDVDVADATREWRDRSRTPISSAQVSPSGRFIAVGSEDRTVRVMEVATLKAVGEGRGHSARVTSLHWSPDERQLVSVGADGCSCIWNFFPE